MSVIKFGFKSVIVKVSSKVEGLTEGYSASGDSFIKSASQRFASINPIMRFLDDYIFIRHRAISSGEHYGANGNWDYFPDSELMKNYSSFINTGFFRDHQNFDKKLAYGINGDSRYHPNHFIELISAVGLKLQKDSSLTCDNIIKGVWDETSMGCEVKLSECSICGNEAETREQYCDHIRFCKGSKVGGKDVYEINHGVTFFEDSLITTEAADKDARVVDVWTNEDADKLLHKAALNKVAYNSQAMQQIMEAMIASSAVETGGIDNPSEWTKAFEEEIKKGFQAEELDMLQDELRRWGRSKIRQMVESHKTKMQDNVSKEGSL
jgi:hypothetical protein